MIRENDEDGELISSNEDMDGGGQASTATVETETVVAAGGA